MTILPIDSCRYGGEKIKKIFDEKKRLQYQLDFEAAVVKAQAHLKIIPSIASKEIVKEIKSGKVTIERVKELESISEHDTGSCDRSCK